MMKGIGLASPALPPPSTLICEKKTRDVQHEIPGFPLRARSRRAAEAGPESAHGGKGRCSAEREISLVRSPSATRMWSP